MKVNLFKDECEMYCIGIRYSKDLFTTGQHNLILSFLRWDLDITW